MVRDFTTLIWVPAQTVHSLGFAESTYSDYILQPTITLGGYL
jgi:hypothetical protein